MNEVVKYILKGVLIVIFQVLILKRIDINSAGFSYFHFLIYPMIIFILPVRTPKSLVIVAGFFIGLFIDMFYDSPGVHASALCFTAFIRPYVLKILEPTDGYSTASVPSIKLFGLAGFFIYASILLIFHLLFYFSAEAFTFVFIGDILLKAIASFIISILLLMLIQVILIR